MRKLSLNNIYKDYYDLVYNAVKGIVKNKEDAEDVSHDVFIKVANALDNNKKPKNVKSWIYKIAQNTSIDFVRDKKHTVEYKDYLYDKEYDPGIEDDMDIAIIEDIILKKISILSKKHIDVFDLYYTNNYTITEVAETLNISSQTASMRLSKIIKVIKE